MNNLTQDEKDILDHVTFYGQRGVKADDMPTFLNLGQIYNILYNLQGMGLVTSQTLGNMVLWRPKSKSA